MKRFTLHNNNPYTLKSKYINRWEWDTLLFHDIILSRDICSKFEWEIKIETLPIEFLTFEMGYYEYPYFSGSAIAGAFYIYSKQSNIDLIGHNRICSKITPDQNTGIKAGDKLGLLIDFEHRECSFHLNGKIIQKTHKNVPKEIILFFSPYTPVDITCTKFSMTQ